MLFIMKPCVRDVCVGSWNSLKKLRRSSQTQSSVLCVAVPVTLLSTASRNGL